MTTASWIRSKQAIKRCNQHAEQVRVFTKVYTRVEKFHATRAQVWKCPQRYKKAHCSPSIRPPEAVSERR